MPDRPIIFLAPTVRALLEGRKTQTRRLLKGEVPRPPADLISPRNQVRHDRPYLDSYCSERITPTNPRGMSNEWCWWTRDDRQGAQSFEVSFVPGDRLWVREAWRIEGTGSRVPAEACRPHAGRGRSVEYRADGYEPEALRERSPIHMPRWASRLTLLVTDVRVQRLHDISEADAIAEGSREPTLREMGGDLVQAAWTERQVYSRLWNHLHGAGTWAANPWVAAITFDVRHANIDAPPIAAREVAHAPA